MECWLATKDINPLDSFTGENIREPSEVGNFDIGPRGQSPVKAEVTRIVAPESREKLNIQLLLLFTLYNVVCPTQRSRDRWEPDGAR